MSGAIRKAAFSIPGPIGKRHVEILTSWARSGSIFGATGFGTLLYFTDWRLFLDYLPFYNTKFDKGPEY